MPSRLLVAPAIPALHSLLCMHFRLLPCPRAPPRPPCCSRRHLAHFGRLSSLQASQFGFSDVWDVGAPSFRGGKTRKGVTSKSCGGFAHSSPPGRHGGDAPAGGFVRGNTVDRFGAPGGQQPQQRSGVQGSSISLGSSSWDGTAASPRGGGGTVMGRGAARVQSPAPMHMRTGPGSGMSYHDGPAAGGGQRPDQRAHLGSNIAFG